MEGNPRERRFVELVLEIRPAQVTLVPDAQGQLTSDHGWTHAPTPSTCARSWPCSNVRDSDLAIRRSRARHGRRRRPKRRRPRGALHRSLCPRLWARSAGGREPLRRRCRACQRDWARLNAGHDLDLHNLRYFVEQVPAWPRFRSGTRSSVMRSISASSRPFCAIARSSWASGSRSGRLAPGSPTLTCPHATGGLKA